nr:insulin-like receptor 1 [Sphaeroma serratum]
MPSKGWAWAVPFLCLASLYPWSSLAGATPSSWDFSHHATEVGTKYCGNVTLYGSDIEKEFEELRQCTVIGGALQIIQCTLPKGATLPNLTQVLDYVILERVENVESLATLFPRLFIVRGLRLLRGRFSFVLLSNRHLREIGPWSLKSFVSGSVFIKDNILFCTDEEIQWKKLVSEEDNATNVFYNNRQFCPFVGCEEENVCRRREKTCSETSLPCPTVQDSQCDPECLGGCFHPHDPTSCSACAHFILDAECVVHCPHGYLKYMNYICISNSSCAMKKQSIYNGDQCVEACPDRYISVQTNPEDETSPRICQLKSVCNSATLTSRYLGDDLLACTSIDGNLVIRVAGGKDVMKRLRQNLGGIVNITGYLMVMGSSTLFSLSFLTSLRTIQGKEMVHTGQADEGYAFYVVENPHLREFWDWDFHSEKIHINGSAFIHFNDQLCDSEITMLEKMTNLEKENINKGINGRKFQCEVFIASLTVVPGSEPGTLSLNWTHFYNGSNSMKVVGYQIFYRQTNENISLYQDRDVCNDKTLWCIKLRKVDRAGLGEKCISLTLTGLLPNTRYAVYVRSLVVMTSKHITRSNIVYGTTYNTNPEPPIGGKIGFTESSITLSWKDSAALVPYPSKPTDVFYEVSVRLERYVSTEDFELDENCNVLEKNSEELVREVLRPSYKPPASADACPFDDVPDESVLLASQEKIISITREISNLLYNRYENIPSTRARTRRDTRTSALECSAPLIQWENSTLKFAKIVSSSPWIPDGNGEPIFTRSETTTGKSITLTNPQDVNLYEQIRVIGKVRACVGKISPCHPLGSNGSCALCSQFHTFRAMDRNRGDTSPLELTAWTSPVGGLEPISGKSSTTQHECHRSKRNEIFKQGIGPTPFHFVPTSLPEIFGQGWMDNETLASENNRSLYLRWNISPELNAITLGYRILYRTYLSPETSFKQFCLPKSEADRRNNQIVIEIQPGKNYLVGVQVQTLGKDSLIHETQVCGETMPNSHGTNHFKYIIPTLVLFVLSLVVILAIFIVVSKKQCGERTRSLVRNPNYGGGDPMADIFNEFRLTRDQFELVKEIGRGQFGVVYEGLMKESEEKVAIKTLQLKMGNKNDSSEALNQAIKAFFKEAASMQDLDSPFLVRLIGLAKHTEDPKDPNGGLSPFLVLEYMDNGNLRQYLDKERPSDEKKVEIAIQVADGMAYLAYKGIIHRDLAARNVLVKSNGLFKICDFGLSRKVKLDYYYIPHEKSILPVRSTAPEALQKQDESKFSIESDVWSYASLLYEIVTDGETPYPQYTNEEVVEMLQKKILYLESPVEHPKILNYWIRQCQIQEPRRRPTFIDILSSLLPQTSHSFQMWFRQQNPFFTSSSRNDSESTEAADEGCCLASSLDASQDDNDLTASNPRMFQQEENEDICLTPKERKCSPRLSLSCIPNSLPRNRHWFQQASVNE